MAQSLDTLFRTAVAAIDAGRVGGLEELLHRHPELAHRRLEEPGAWLRDQVGDALDGFFARPYLLWFVAEDPVRNGTLPDNISEVARAILAVAAQAGADALQQQVDYTLSLVAWSSVAHRCGVQLELLDVLIDAGGSLAGVAENALVNGHVEAARHLVQRGAPLTLATALVLDLRADAERLAAEAGSRERQRALVLAALNGRADGLSLLIRAGVDVSAPSEDVFSHATPLHHAVCSGSLDAVRALVEAGAELGARDEAFRATPREWAEYYRDGASGERSRAFAGLADYLRSRES